MGTPGNRGRRVSMATEPVGRSVQPDRQEGEIGRGLRIARHFVPPGTNPYDTVEWEIRSAVISGESGETVFEQRDVEGPKSWAQLATNVVVSKYFRGPLGTPQRERSVRQLIGRVVDTIAEWRSEEHTSELQSHSFISYAV